MTLPSLTSTIVLIRAIINAVLAMAVTIGMIVVILILVLVWDIGTPHSCHAKLRAKGGFEGYGCYFCRTAGLGLRLGALVEIETNLPDEIPQWKPVVVVNERARRGKGERDREREIERQRHRERERETQREQGRGSRSYSVCHLFSPLDSRK